MPDHKDRAAAQRPAKAGQARAGERAVVRVKGRLKEKSLNYQDMFQP